MLPVSSSLGSRFFCSNLVGDRLRRQISIVAGFLGVNDEERGEDIMIKHMQREQNEHNWGADNITEAP